jgi:cytoskeleton protein RodZ
MTEEHQEQQQYLSPISPGKRLREAREAAGLSRGEVALHMRINERKVAALEEDNYEEFPSETFVSGYLRSYAKVLGLPESDFVRPVSSTELPPSLLPTSNDKKQASSMDLPVRMVTYVIVVVIIASLGAWWISQREMVSDVSDEPATASIPDEPNQPAMDNVVTEPQPSEPVVGDENTVAEAESSETVVAESASTTTEPSSEKPPVNETDSSVAPQKTDSPLVAPPVVVALDKASNDESAAKDEEPSPPPLSADTPISKLVFEYQDDSWTEVDDSAGRRLVYGLMRAGQTIEIKGEAPFKVFLGFAEGVTVHYNNNLFDFTPFRRGDVARFRIGRAEHNQPGPR